jgi:L,D-transpeptidase catalytic domain
MSPFQIEAWLLLHAAPGSQRVLASLKARTIFGSPMRLAVVGTSGDWLAVISAALGNHIRGFVHRSKVRLVHDPFSLEVDRSSRWVRLWRMGYDQTRLAHGWTGGDRMAIHDGSDIGDAVSNGCLRAAETDMRYLMAMLPLGTQVVVHD